MLREAHGCAYIDAAALCSVNARLPSIPDAAPQTCIEIITLSVSNNQTHHAVALHCHCSLSAAAGAAAAATIHKRTSCADIAEGLILAFTRLHVKDGER
jgi:hypothetical protein